LPGSRWWTPDRVCLPAVCGLLLLAVGLVFGQTAGFGFVNLDDTAAVYQNRLVTGELTLRGVWAVFTRGHFESWAPLTGLSHMLVWHLLGHGAAVHHLTNVCLHAAAAVVLLMVLWQMTGCLWPSALAAAVFAVHPLRVESVAWVTERKDVLSGLFFMLTLAAYLGYVRRPFSLGRYLTVLVCFAVGLAAKPMAVTLPFLLLLLDYWPLGRMGDKKPQSSIAPSVAAGFSVATKARSTIAPLWRLILEKLPLLAIACLFCLWTVHAQEAATLEANQRYSLLWRIGNAMIAYAFYLGKFSAPVDLAAFYPRVGDLPPWQVAASSLLLAGITAAAFVCRRRFPYLLVGWLWYLGMMLPVIGLLQIGLGNGADRFTYLPQIGLSIAIVWAVADGKKGTGPISRNGPLGASQKLDPSPLSRPMGRAAASVCVLTALIVAAWRQTGYWRDSETLWTHTLACTSGSSLAHINFGLALAGRGRIDEAIAHYRKALEIEPDSANAHNNLGLALAGRGRIDEAMLHYQRALKIEPDFALAHNNLGLALAGRGRIDEAIAQYQRALEIQPDFAMAHNNLGLALAGRGRIDEAIAHYRKALEIEPDNAEVHNNLGLALAGHGRVDEAIAHYRKALEIKPDYAEAHNNFGTALARCGRAGEAIGHFRKALKIRPDYAEAHFNLGTALAGRGRIDEALDCYRKALALAEEQNNAAVAEAVRARLRLLAPPPR
jgi:tetratricopeptide (TPR) repeat protein